MFGDGADHDPERDHRRPPERADKAQNPGAGSARPSTPRRCLSLLLPLALLPDGLPPLGERADRIVDVVRVQHHGFRRRRLRQLGGSSPLGGARDRARCSTIPPISSTAEMTYASHHTGAIVGRAADARGRRLPRLFWGRLDLSSPLTWQR